MPEGRDSYVFTRIEPSLRALVARVERRTGQSASSYVRSCIIKDLVDRGLVAQDELLRITSLTSKEVMELIKKAS